MNADNLSGIENLAAGEDPAERYPECRNAIRVCSGPALQAALGRCREANQPLYDVLGKIKICYTNYLAGRELYAAAIGSIALTEMDHPQFRQYLAAKLGLV